MLLPENSTLFKILNQEANEKEKEDVDEAKECTEFF
jgi:hypothetical protein